MQGLKEWATVVKALENGDQCIILRKGGILETASGFKIESKKFVLFPTYEHQEKKHIKPEFHNYLKTVKESAPQNYHNLISSFAEVLAEADIESDEKINALNSFHIWSESYIKERKNWKPEKPLKAIFLKVFKIPVQNIPIKSEYQGCKSWININEQFPSGKAVLDEQNLNSKLKKFVEIIN